MAGDAPWRNRWLWLLVVLIAITINLLWLFQIGKKDNASLSFDSVMRYLSELPILMSSITFILVLLIVSVVLRLVIAWPHWRDQKSLFAEVVLQFTPPGIGDSTIKYQTSANTNYLGIRHSPQKTKNLTESHSIANLLVRLDYLDRQTHRPFEITETAVGKDKKGIAWTFKPSVNTERRVDDYIDFRNTHPRLAKTLSVLFSILIVGAYLLAATAVINDHITIGLVSGALLALLLYVASVRRAKREQLFVSVDCDRCVISHNIHDLRWGFFDMTFYFKEAGELKELCQNLKLIHDETKCPLALTLPRG